MQKIKTYLIYLIVFLLPLFFLPITQEFFATNKLYFLGFSVLLLLLVSTIQFAFNRKINLPVSGLDIGVGLILTTTILSTLLTTPNKIGALFNINFGLLEIFLLVALYVFISRLSDTKKIVRLLFVAGIILGLLFILLTFQPLTNFNLPPVLNFLKSPNFTPLGTIYDFVIYMGFLSVYAFINLVGQNESQNADSNHSQTLIITTLIVGVFALLLGIYSLIKTSSPTIITNAALFPPFNLSWNAAVEILKNPLTAFFGAGLDNFSSVFTKVKDAAYNQSNLWQISSFSTSRSMLFHTLTESGILGLLSLLYLFFLLLKNNLSKTKNLAFLVGSFYLILVSIFFPPSLIIFFLLFILLALTMQSLETEENNNISLDLTSLNPAVYSFVFVAGALIVTGLYLLSRSYMSEYHFKKSLDAYAQNNAKELYDNQRKATLENPTIERYHIQFSQTNILIANRIAQKALTAASKTQSATSSAQITATDRQVIASAVQAAISEAKAAVTLNQQKSQNWENLGEVYRNILNVVQGSDAWSISAYQRAISLDPKNPNYRISFGGIYYSLGNYDEAIKHFEEAALLKTDFVNARYNLAWASFQKGDYNRAVSEMQYSLSLLSANKDSEDYKKAVAELESFKKKQSNPPE